MIVPVKRVKAFILEEDKEQLLLTLQKKGLMMIDPHVESAPIDTRNEDEVVQRAKSAINKLSKYQNKKGFFEYQSVPYEDFINEDDKRFDLLKKIELDLDNFNKVTEENKVLTELKDRIKPFSEMQYETKDLSKTIYVTFYTGFIPEANYESAVKYLEDKKIEHNFFELSDLGHPLIFVLDKDLEEELIKEFEAFKFLDANLPKLNMTISKYLALLNEDIKSNISRLEYLEDLFTNAKEVENELKILIDQTLSKKDRMLVPFKETAKTVYVTGWVREDQIETLEDSIKEFTKTYDLDISDPSEDEAVPTALQNNKFVSQFETITDMYSTPNHLEVDPNPVMSIWYWIIFGIMMGDIGYGLAMIVVFGLFIKFKKPKGDFSKLVHIFFYSGFTAIAAGIVFGSVFGADVNIIGMVGNLFGKTWNSFSIMNDPLSMLIFSIALGVAHLISGLVLKVRLSLIHNDLLTALADGFSWISILIGGTISVIGIMLLDSKPILYVGLVLVAIGVLLILTLAGREKKGIFSKITSGLGGLYNSTSYLSDLLSYSRILALALSTSVIAFTMNLLAGLVQGSAIGWVFAIIIYIVGHSFNFAMGLLSTYVHDSRLQYIEFFNKFYEGGGTKFKPLSFKTENINEITH